MSKRLEIPARFEDYQIKAAIHGIKRNAGYYQVEPPPKKVNPNEELLNIFERMYGVLVTSINKNQGDLRVGVHGNNGNGINDTGVTAIGNCHKSTTTQRFGAFLAYTVIKRKDDPKYQGMITSEAVVAARRIKEDLEKRL